MKRCPECRRDYYDDTLLYCLDDGNALLEGPAKGRQETRDGSPENEPQTAILSVPPAVAGGLTRSVDYDDERPTAILPGLVSDELESSTAILQPPATAGGSDSSADKLAFSANKATKPLIALVVAVVILVGGFYGYRYFVSSPRQIESIAVMPFVNESGSTEFDYLSDGMTETLIRSLSQIPNLAVKSRSMVFYYKGKETSPKKIGEELGVQAVLLGRVGGRGDDLKLNLELVNTNTQNVIWTEQYDRKQTDLLNLQGEIARDVSGKLRSKLSGENQQTVTKKYTEDSEAYRLYLQARFYLNKRVGKEYQKAGPILRQAVERDPNFALGYVGLAEFIDDDDRLRAKEYILRALAIDNELSEAHSAYGYQLALDRDWAASERELKRAIELDPRNARAHQSNGSRLMFIGQHQQCLAAFDRAIELEPTFADIRVNRGTCLMAAGRLDEGIAEVKKAIEFDPSYPWAHSALSYLYRMKGDQPASVEARARSAELVDRPDLAKRLRDTFRERGWKAYLQELFDQTAELFPNLVRRASILCELGRPDEALSLLDQAAAKGEWWLFIVKIDPQFQVLRDDSRFQAIVKQFDPPQ